MERKVKYSYAFKLECIELAIKNHYSLSYVSKQKDIDKSMLRKWFGIYKVYGKAGLHPRINTSYTVDFKLMVLKTMESKSSSLSSIRLQFNIPTDSIILKWQKDFVKFGINGLQPKPRGRPTSMINTKPKKPKSDKPLTREDELLKENERLRCENDLLKKLHALAQARKKQEPL
jgi:transposase